METSSWYTAFVCLCVSFFFASNEVFLHYYFIFVYLLYIF
uniref:Uncharacterized protein n=1 Tax=Anguilla anguilla TaxID=7936 RepID=A0A0E9PVD2_ANGAN